MARARSLTMLLLVSVALGSTVAPVDAKKKSKVVPSGFLGDYSELESHSDMDDLLYYRLREGVLGDYDRFIIDQPLVYFHSDSAGHGVDPNDLKMLSDFLREKMVEALTKDEAYEVVQEPGDGVARLRIAITDVVPVDPKKNLAPKAVGMAVGVGLLVPRTDLGRASIEAEILDSQSGERLAAVVTTKQPKRFGGMIKGAKEWGDVKAAFKQWATRFRARLDEVHGE